MHRLTEYESYLLDESAKYGFSFCHTEKCLPPWLVLERETYGWMFRLSRRMYNTLQNAVVSSQLRAIIEKIPTNRFLKYRDISPGLKEAISDIGEEFFSLNEDLKRPEMCKQPGLLSKEGLDRWEKSARLVFECVRIVPDPAWRENWEKEREFSYHTREEAENSASD